jgi:hypothetical protein
MAGIKIIGWIFKYTLSMLQISYFIVLLYSISIVLLFLYSLAHFNLLLNYLKSKKTEDQSQYNLENLNSFVTIQLPIYMKICDRTFIDYYCKNGLSTGQAEIQVLDDALDDSVMKLQH